MALGIEKSLEVVRDLEVLAANAVAIAKSGVGITSLHKIFSLLDAAKELLADAPKALPELKDLDASESGRLAAACYTAVQGVIVALAK